MAYGDKEIDQMDNSEIRAELKYLIKATQENTESLKTLTELSIRREERDSRQFEINTKQEEINREVFGRLRNIEFARAKEENGRNFIQKYYPYLMAACMTGGGIIAYWAPRLLS